MAAILLGFGFAAIAAIVVIAGDVAIKIAADAGHPVVSHLVALACLIYAGSAVLWFFALRHATLAQAAVAYSMVTLVALCLIGVVWFGERLEAREVAGIGLAVVAMGLMARVA